MEKFLQRRNEILGESALFLLRRGCIAYQRFAVPLVVVLTKVDLLDLQLELDLPANETLEHCKSKYLNEHCIGPLLEVVGSEITHVTVSCTSDWCHRLLMNGF